MPSSVHHKMFNTLLVLLKSLLKASNVFLLKIDLKETYAHIGKKPRSIKSKF